KPAGGGRLAADPVPAGRDAALSRWSLVQGNWRAPEHFPQHGEGASRQGHPRLRRPLSETGPAGAPARQSGPTHLGGISLMQPQDLFAHYQQVEEEAANWICERDEGFTPERERAFLLWLNQDSLHQRAF